MEKRRGSGSDDPAREVAVEQANTDECAELVRGDQQGAHALAADSVNSGQRNNEESMDKEDITTSSPNKGAPNRPSIGLAQIHSSSFYDKSNFRVGLQVSRAQDLNLGRNKQEATMCQALFLGSSDPHDRKPRMR